MQTIDWSDLKQEILKVYQRDRLEIHELLNITFANSIDAMKTSNIVNKNL